MAATAVEYPIRRERWFPHISAENKRSYFSFLQLDLEAGVGLTTGQGSDPLVVFDWSDDGGHTFKPQRTKSAGKLGEYTTRCVLWQLGESRDRVFRFSVTDPVQWSIINGYVQVKAGTS